MLLLTKQNVSLVSFDYLMKPLFKNMFWNSKSEVDSFIYAFM